ncbi:MAG TPA: HAMP domain-containing sensor histidine kinase [Atribacter sp.]|jgi:two-component system sensor histidine kinase ArlS|uniref:histidine kinase n=2 Tax=Atribacter TaxID=2847777 RepID=A0A1V5T2I9_9BACT|nr:HAMP domain-containing sensor histidine kinase [Atribacter sp.]OQA61009.1 MAG: Sensor protein QseC [Candidatus Atribacteria bacterium ADurb.Bin276]HQK82532.1 HAMP domain-containing sensor histidine kinase [Atribacter sp.]
MKLSVRMTLFNFICLFALTLLAFSILYGFSRKSILTSEEEDIFRRSQAGGMRMMHGLMARGRAFPGDFLVGTRDNQTLKVVQNPWDLDPQLWKEGLVERDGEHFLFVSIDRSGGDYLLGKNVSTSIRSLERIRIVAWYLIPILAGLVLFVGYFLSEYWLKPLRELNRTLYKMSSENLSSRFSVASTLDEIEELKLALNKMLHSFEQGYLIQKRFVSNVSHQLRTPLSSIIGYIQMLQRWGDENPEVRKEAIDAIEKTAQEMKELTESLLSLSRTGHITEMTDIALDLVIKSIVEQWQTKNPQRLFRLFINASPHLKISVDHLKILMDVLLDNALKYSMEQIDITIDEKNIIVRDYGPGIPAEIQARLGERFLRGRNTVEKPGWGVGLSLAFEIADKFGWKLFFENATPGPGLKVLMVFSPNQTIASDNK